MKAVYASLGFALGASAAVVAPRSSCCFSLTASGDESGTVGQLSDGQNRIGGGLAAAQYCIDNGAITDDSGRGCILTPPTTQFQCDSGASPQSGFSVSSSGTLQYGGSSSFVACPTGDNGEYNIYTTAPSGQGGCVAVSLGTGGTCSGSSASSSAASASSTSASSAPQSSAPASTAPASSAPASSAPASSAPESSAPASSPPASSAPESSAPASSAPATSAQESSAPATSAPASSASASWAKTWPAHTWAPKSSAPAWSAKTWASSWSSETSVPATTYAASESAKSSAPAPSSAPASFAAESSAPAPTSAPVSSPAESPMSTTAAASSASTTAPSSSAPASSSPSKSASSATAHTTGSACQTSLSGAYQTPHLIVPIDSSAPDKAYGTQYDASISSDNSTIFNFDIPASYASKTCSLVFLWPTLAELETSSFTTAGSGDLVFTKLDTVAGNDVTYDSAGSGAVVGTVGDAKPGNGYVVWEGACAAGTTQSFEVSVAGGDLSLEFFEDYNPSPIGVFVTTC